MSAQHHIKQLQQVEIIEFDHNEIINGITARYLKISDKTMRVKLHSFILILNSFITGLIVPVLSLLLMDKGATLSTISANKLFLIIYNELIREQSNEETIEIS